VKARSRCSDQCDCSASRSNLSTGRFGGPRPVISRSSYAAFMLQGLALIVLAIALRPLPLHAEVKALIMAGGGVVGSFALAWPLIGRVPG
jgi:hypothetical protein